MAQRPFGGPSGSYEPHQKKDYEDKEEYNYGIRGGRFRRYYSLVGVFNSGTLTTLSWKLSRGRIQACFFGNYFLRLVQVSKIPISLHSFSLSFYFLSV